MPNKAYDRQVVEVGEYLQALTQSEWDIFIEEDFRARIDNIKVVRRRRCADYDDDDAQLLADVDVRPLCRGRRFLPSCEGIPPFITSPPIIMLRSLKALSCI